MTNIQKYIPASVFVSKFSEISKGTFPMVIHRILAYDDKFPKKDRDCLEKFYDAFSKYFIQVIWFKNDLLSIMSFDEMRVFLAYKKNIQRADFGRYVVLERFGGIYSDFDIEINERSADAILHVIQRHNDKECILFEELVLSESFVEETKKFPIRKGIPEERVRIANYFMISKPNSKFVQDVIDLCIKRSNEDLKTDYDVIYTTGPDVVSTIFDLKKKNANLLKFDKKSSDAIFSHKAHGHWRGI